MKSRRVGVSQDVGLRASQMLGRSFAKLPFQDLKVEFCVNGENVNNISPYHYRVYRAFYAPIMRIKQLQCLTLTLNGVVLDLSKLPRTLHTLCLKLSSSGMERRCLPSLAKYLRRAKSLQCLELTNWSLDRESMRILALGNSYLTSLDIRGNQGNDCVEDFVDTWPIDSPLKKLSWLGRPTLTASGVQQLLRSTALHPAFEYLSFDFQETDQLNAIKTIASEMSCLRLRELRINATLPRTRHVSTTLIPEHHRVETLRALVPAIQSNRFLRYIGVTCGGVENMNGRIVNVMYDLLDDYDFKFYWRRNRFGARFLLDAHRFADAACCYIFAALRRDPSVLYSLLRERPDLVR